MFAYLISTNHESLYLTTHSSMSQTLHRCKVCGELIKHGVKALIHHVVGSRFRFPSTVFVMHWEDCAEKAGLR